MKQIETQDLIIRDSVWEDLELFFGWERLPQVTDFLSIGENQSFEEVVRTYIHDDENPKQRQYTICLKEDATPVDGRPIGRVVLGDLEEGWKVEIWRIYIGDLAQRGKGLGRQTLEAMLKLCFDKFGLKRVYLDHYTGNPAGELYKSLGFQYEGVLRGNCMKNGELYDVHLMSMMRDEYIALYGREDG